MYFSLFMRKEMSFKKLTEVIEFIKSDTPETPKHYPDEKSEESPQLDELSRRFKI